MTHGPREMRDPIEGVRKYGNTGTHFQIDGDVSETSAAITASARYAPTPSSTAAPSSRPVTWWR